MNFFASIPGDLDATWYFFASSGLFILLTAGFFGGVGLWIGGLTWGRYKRRWRRTADELEAVKSENVLLKRRAAEFATRTSGAKPPQGVVSASLAALIQPRSERPKTFPGRPFSIWTEDSWSPAPFRSAALPPGRAFTLWPQPGAAPAVRVQPVPSTTSISSGAGETLVFAIEHQMPVPASRNAAPAPSRAFTLWTEKSWKPRVVRMPPLPRSAAFCVWTADGWMPPASTKPLRAVVAARMDGARGVAKAVAATATVSLASNSVLEARNAVHPPRSAAFSIWMDAPQASVPLPATAKSTFAKWLQAKAQAAHQPGGPTTETV